MAGGRAERTNDLFIDDDGLGNPTEEGQVRHTGGDLVVYISGSVKSLTTGSGLNPASHRALDQLVHDVAEDSFTEYTYGGPFGRLSNETIWTDAGKTTKIRETQFTYTGIRVTQVVTIQYDGSGVEVERTTDTITYAFPVGNKVASVTTVKLP